MKKQTTKPTTTTITTLHAAETTMTELARVENNRRQFIARLDSAILKLQEAAAPGLEKFDTEIQARTDALRAWALTSPEDFGKKKSIIFIAGTIGFRTGTPALEPLNKKWNWRAITAAVAQTLPGFIRTKPEVDRAALLARRTDPAIVATLPTLGLRIVQSEAFYVEAKLTEVKG